MRTREKLSLLVGLMWADPQRTDVLEDIRWVGGRVVVVLLVWGES